MNTTERHAFINRLRILHSLDRHEIAPIRTADWIPFRDDPARFLIRADDSTAARIMDAIERRET